MPDGRSRHAAREAVMKEGALPVPLHLRNAPTKRMKSLGYGGGYQYPHHFEGHYVPEDSLPEALRARSFYSPSQNGEEAKLSERYEDIQRQLAERLREPGEDG